MSDVTSVSRRAAVVGVGTTAYGSFPDQDEYSLGAQAFRNALEDGGIKKHDIDGLLVCRIPNYAWMGEVLGINPRWTLPLPPHGRMSGMGIIEAAVALATGRATCIALIYANLGRSRRVSYGGGETGNFWDPWGLTSPGAGHALMFQRHMALYGTTTRQLAEVSVAFRHHATLNPTAVMQKPITIEDHEASRPIVEPLRLLDYCLINDGAVCMIMTTPERARDFKKKPVFIAGVGGKESYSYTSFPHFDPDFWYEPTRDSGREAFDMAGVNCNDVDLLTCYDNFSPTVLFALEGLGFCGRGESGPFVEGGTLKLGGRLPTNTDGGHLSNSYMQGWALNVEAVRQIRGEGGERQVANCEVAQFVEVTPCCRSIIYTP